jgi:hypothetical protein
MGRGKARRGEPACAHPHAGCCGACALATACLAANATQPRCLPYKGGPRRTHLKARRRQAAQPAGLARRRRAPAAAAAASAGRRIAQQVHVRLKSQAQVRIKLCAVAARAAPCWRSPSVAVRPARGPCRLVAVDLVRGVLGAAPHSNLDTSPFESLRTGLGRSGDACDLPVRSSDACALLGRSSAGGFGFWFWFGFGFGGTGRGVRVGAWRSAAMGLGGAQLWRLCRPDAAQYDAAG